jgi:hypoxanthine phosphoribosyltransferase
LALAAAHAKPELILAIGRGGFYPGTLLAHLMRIEIFPVRVSRRIDDVVVYAKPRWHVRPPDRVAGKRVLVVDEIAGTGQTLAMVAAESGRLGAAEVRTAVLYAHPADNRGDKGLAYPDYVGILSDALFLNPWDREVLVDGVFQWHPEYTAALSLQGLEASDVALIEVEAAALAVGGSEPK